LIASFVVFLILSIFSSFFDFSKFLKIYSFVTSLTFSTTLSKTIFNLLNDKILFSSSLFLLFWAVYNNTSLFSLFSDSSFIFLSILSF
jgi:hypothetical protein